MSWHRISALVLRYTYLYRRSVPRLLEMFFWPVMDLLVWGFVTMYLIQVGEGLPRFIMFFIGAMIFWDILYRAQQGVTLSFLEDVWTRNLLNLFVAPIRVREFLAATYLVGLMKIAMITTLLTILAAALYQFHLMALGLSLIPFFINLLLMGWAVGMVTTSLILRWGQAAEALAWGVPFFIQPFAAVFYPVEILPRFIQPISQAIPATHVFEGMRQVLRGEGVDSGALALAFGLNAIWLIAAGLLFSYTFNLARQRGLLAKLVTQ